MGTADGTESAPGREGGPNRTPQRGDNLQNGSTPRWDDIFAALEAWRSQRILEDAAAEDPSVTSLAREYTQSPWAVLVSTILSLRTKDQVTLKTSHQVLDRAPTPAALLALSQDEVSTLTYPAGFYRTKAKNLLEIAAILIRKYGGRVPADMDALLDLPGVGRKTANLVLTEAFDLPGICVDIHVHRICNRTGWVRAKDPDSTEAVLRTILPRSYWKRINALLVQYGQRVCKPVSPVCSRCAIPDHCLRVGVGRSR